jgi:hypothetical protein
MQTQPPPGVIIETVQLGRSARVCAHHLPTGTEACVTGPAASADNHLRSMALSALARRLAARPDSSAPESPTTPPGFA